MNILWIKAFHIIAVIFWSAGLLYLPRLFVYHAESVADKDDIGQRRFMLMERRLYWGIMLPAMLATLIFGLLLLPHYSGGWIGAKLLVVFLLLCFHGYCGFVIYRFAAHRTPHSPRFFRLFNELAPLFIAAIVLLVVLKPF